MDALPWFRCSFFRAVGIFLEISTYLHNADSKPLAACKGCNLSPEECLDKAQH